MEVIADNDVSASTGRPRQGFIRVLKMGGARAVDVVVCWAADRRVRRLVDLEDVIERCQRTGVRLATVSGDLDLSADAGRLVARLTSDVSNLSRILGWALLELVWGTLAIACVAGVMFALNWRLALIVLIPLAGLSLQTAELSLDPFWSIVKRGAEDAGIVAKAQGGSVTWLGPQNYDNLGVDAAELIRQALNEALAQEMRRDPTVIVIGEDVAGGAGSQGQRDAYGGVLGVTKGLIGEFGEARVIDTPITESAIMGAAAGAAVTGLRPVAELMFSDFFGVCFDQIFNQAAKFRYMFGGKAKTPLVIRTMIGAGRSAAAQHSQSPYHIFTSVPGLKCVVPSNAYDAKGLLIEAIRDDDPVIFCEHKLMYDLRAEVPDEVEELPDLLAGLLRRCGLIERGLRDEQVLESRQVSCGAGAIHSYASRRGVATRRRRAFLLDQVHQFAAQLDGRTRDELVGDAREARAEVETQIVEVALVRLRLGEAVADEIEAFVFFLHQLEVGLRAGEEGGGAQDGLHRLAECFRLAQLPDQGEGGDGDFRRRFIADLRLMGGDEAIVRPGLRQQPAELGAG